MGDLKIKKIDPSQIRYTPEEGELKIKDILIPEVISSIGLIEITKEEFYNLNAQFIIKQYLINTIILLHN